MTYANVFMLITDLGDSALLLPASAFLLVYCLYRGSRPEATNWAITLMFCGAMTLFLKIVLRPCGTENQLINIHNPSGHASFSMTFYMCSSMMMTAERKNKTRGLLLVASGLLALAIAASRIVLQKHSVSEVALGLLVGAASVAWFSWQSAERRAALPWQPFVGAVVLLALVTQYFYMHIGVEEISERLHAMLLGPACFLL